jgi:nitrogen fixation NifU-like protein
MTGIRNKLKEHLRKPLRMGEIENADGTGIVGNARCGEILTFQVKVADNRLTQIRFQCLGCGAAKAVASYLAELAEGKTVEEVEKIRMEELFKELEGLPRSKWHCPFQAMDALLMAIADWRSKEHKGMRKMIDVEPVPPLTRCPFCSSILGEPVKGCESCDYKSVKCRNCGKEISVQEGRK